MNLKVSTLRDTRVALLEVLTLLVLLTVYVAAMLLGCSVDAQIYATVALLCTLLALCWRNTGGGMHPCFLFLGLLLLFQGGHLLAFCMDPSQVSPLRLESSNGVFDPAIPVQRLTLLTIVVSAVFLYLPVRISGPKLVYAPPPTDRLNSCLLGVFVATLPFLAWKNYQYLSFVNSHGGYIAIYLAHDELVAQAGTLVRVLSRICATSFLVYFAYERPNRRLVLTTVAYFSVSVMELLVGLRGDVMLTAIGCLFLWKLKRGMHFTIRSLVFLSLGLAILGQILAGSREHRETDTTYAAAPSLFLFTQGASIGVPEVLISNRDQFARLRLTYLRNSLITPLFPATHFSQGQILEKDLNIYLNRTADASGYGIGGSYLADTYFYGGMAGVVAGAIVIGCSLVYLAQFLTAYTAPYALGMAIHLVYLPRSSIATELVGGLQLWITISLVLVLASGVRHIAKLYRLRFGANRLQINLRSHGVNL